jgi:hypothetical protein
MLNDTEHRILYKAYGLRIIINVSGQAGKFNLLNLTLTIGSGMELLIIARILSDFVLLKFVKNKKSYKIYKEIKYNDNIEDLEGKY